MRGLIILVVLLLLTACAGNQLIDDGNGTVGPPPPPEIRPDIPRVDVPPGDPIGTKESTRFEEIKMLLSDGAQTGIRKAEDGFYVGGPGDPLLVGDTIGEHMPTLTKFELPWLIAPNPGYPGPEIPVEQLVRFYFEDVENGTGYLRFQRSRTSKLVRSSIFFPYKEPMFEYAYLLYASNFQAMEGLEIDFFGSKYWIYEAHPTSLDLYGVDTEKHLVLRNDSSLWLNGKEYSHTNVTVSPWSVIIRYTAPRSVRTQGVALYEGENLRSKIPAPEIFLYDKLDIVYEGLEGNIENAWIIESVGDSIRADFINLIGDQVELFTHCPPWGTDDKALHVKECSSSNDFCIERKDRFTITSQGGVSSIFEFRAVNDMGSVAEFREYTTGETHVVEVAETRQTREGLPVLEGELRYADSRFRVRILYNESDRGHSRLSMDQNGDLGISGREIPLVLAQGYELRFGEGNLSSCNLDFVALPIIGHKDFRTEEVTKILVNSLQVSAVDELDYTLSTDLELFQVEDEREWVGKTERGVFVTMRETETGDRGGMLLFDYPPDFASGLVRIVT
ncbi:hypothetical protein GOV07_03865 [Candidatus Woesearchaeota archaeon]|nr:hypothetical protein [Candidatus Woesearchaeota archaeon]